MRLHAQNSSNEAPVKTCVTVAQFSQRFMHTAKMGSWLRCTQTGSIVGLETRRETETCDCTRLHAQNSSNEAPVKTCTTVAQSSQRFMHTAKMGSWLQCTQTGSIVGLETRRETETCDCTRKTAAMKRQSKPVPQWHSPVSAHALKLAALWD